MDLRIQKTYRALNEAFTRLLSQTRYENISVAAICEEAMIRRTTFYKHFRDKNAYFVFFIDSLRKSVLERGEQQAGESKDQAAIREEIIRQLADFLLDHRAIMDNIFRSTMSGAMTLVISDVVVDALRERYRGTIDGSSTTPDELERAAEFAAGGIVQMMLNWWRSSKLEEGKEEFIKATSELVGRVMEC